MMPLGTEVGLGPCYIVLDGFDPPPTERGTTAPHSFRPTLLWHGRPSQQLMLSSCCLAYKVLHQLLSNSYRSLFF